MSGVSEKFTAIAPHPLQRAWDVDLIAAWQDGNIRLVELCANFSARHLGGVPLTRASGLKRVPLDNENRQMPVRPWMNEVGLEKISAALLRRNIHIPGTPVPGTLIDNLTASKLDCTTTYAEGKAANDVARAAAKGRKPQADTVSKHYRVYQAPPREPGK